jgi:cell cycle checkpoint protein
MKSPWLKDALSEIDPSCDFVTIICNPAQKVTRGKGRVGEASGSFFRIEAKSSRGSVEVIVTLQWLLGWILISPIDGLSE